MNTDVAVAVVGATGLVGETMLEMLAERQFAVTQVHALASSASAGKRMRFADHNLVVREASQFDFSQVQVALFSAGSEVAREHGQRAAAAGCLVIDNSSAFRNDDDKLLIVPEINGHLMADLQPGQGAIIANPNCSTIQMLMVLAPLHRDIGIARVNVSTYQSVSGAGRTAMEALARNALDRLSMREPKTLGQQHCMAFDVWPQIDELQDNGYTREEMKMLLETRKILGDQQLHVNATAVRVPVFNGHAMTVHIEFKAEVDMQRVQAILEQQVGVRLMNTDQHWPSPVQQTGSDEVYVGRLRRDLGNPCAINCWIVADNIRKGAALNAIQIMEQWLRLLQADEPLHERAMVV